MIHMSSSLTMIVGLTRNVQVGSHKRRNGRNDQQGQSKRHDIEHDRVDRD